MTIQQVQENIAKLIAEMEASDFIGWTEGEPQDAYYELAKTSLFNASVYLGLCAAKEGLKT